MATARYNRARDFGLLLKNLSSFSNNQARVVTYDEDQLDWVDIEIRPSGGLYEGGVFFFKIVLEEGFPIHPPTVRSISPIYHPNIDPQSQDVCLNLWGEWSSSFGLQDAVQGLLFLMYEPNLDSMLVGYVQPDTFDCDVASAMGGTLAWEGDNDNEQLELFKKDNNKYVEVYYDKLGTDRKMDGGATAAEAAVPLADVFSNHVTTVLDKERMDIKLDPVDIPHGSMIPSNFHSRQVHKLKKSSTIHGLLHHPDIEVLTTHLPPQWDSKRRFMLKRTASIWQSQLEEQMAHSKRLRLSEHVEAPEPLYVSGRTDQSKDLSMSDEVPVQDNSRPIESTAPSYESGRMDDQLKDMSMTDEATIEAGSRPMEVM